MKKIINGRSYDTEKAKQLKVRYAGEYGEAHGYEERLYLTKSGQYFIFGVGGPDSPYPQPTIKPIEKEQADEWETEASEDSGVGYKKVSKAKKSAKNKDARSKKPRKPPAKNL